MTDSQREPFKSIPIEEARVGMTLANLLKELEPEWSWGKVKQRILSRHVDINGNLCLDPARRLTTRDHVRLWDVPRPKPVDAESIQMVYVDPYLVIIDKPPGVTSARHYEERSMSNRRRQLQPTLEELLPESLTEWFAAQAPRARHANLPDKRRRLLEKNQVIAVHRLDRDTSGLMVFARTPVAAEALGKLFRRHEIERRYWAVARGVVEAQRIESYLIRDVGGGRRGSTTDPSAPGAQRAVTHITPVKPLLGHTLVECRLETGRTHQIRIHLAEKGHPLAGERLYGLDLMLESSVPSPPRHALHAFRLGFVHPMTQEALNFRSGWPKDLQGWFKQITLPPSIGSA